MNKQIEEIKTIVNKYINRSEEQAGIVYGEQFMIEELSNLITKSNEEAYRENEKMDKAIEWAENARYNLDNMEKIGIVLLPIVKEQLDNAIKYLYGENVSEDVMGSIPKESNE